jgi:hypothetical protein
MATVYTEFCTIQNEFIQGLASILHTRIPPAQRCPTFVVLSRRYHNSAQPRGSALVGCQTQTGADRTSSCAKIRLQTHDREMDHCTHIESAGQTQSLAPASKTHRKENKKKENGGEWSRSPSRSVWHNHVKEKWKLKNGEMGR